MKKNYLTIGILVAVNFAAVLVFTAFMPNEVPVHFDMAGEANQIGSKYRILIMPFMGIAIGALLLLIEKFGDKEDTKSMGKVNVIIQLVLIAISVTWSLAVLLVDDVQTGTIFVKATAIILGVLLLALGNAMPKANTNFAFGVRTPWSMSNEEIWQKSQRFGGYASIVAGLALVICGIVVDVQFIGPIIVGAVIFWGLICVIASYKIYRDNLSGS